MLRILNVANPDDEAVLRAVSEPVNFAATEHKILERLAHDMVQSMRRAQGVGLAAPQVGQRLRLIVIHRDADDALRNDLVLLNPIVTKFSSEQVDMEEGCLSIPGVYGVVSRARRIECTALDLSGEIVKMSADGMLARVIQHEVDHLDGVLFTDRTTRITRNDNLK